MDEEVRSIETPVCIDELKNRRWTVQISNKIVGLDLNSACDVNEVDRSSRSYTGAQIGNVMLGADSTSVGLDLSALNVTFVDNEIRALQTRKAERFLSNATIILTMSFFRRISWARAKLVCMSFSSGPSFKSMHKIGSFV